MAKRLGERLIEAGLATADGIEKALQQQKITGHRLGDCLVEIGIVAEAALLRFLAAELNTRFVSADKLAKVKISSEVLDKVPVRMAEAQTFIPLGFDSEQKILSVVMSEPQNQELVKEIALVTESASVTAYIGLRSAIQAAIRKHYYSDANAFSQLSSDGATLPSDPSEGSDGRSVSGLRFESGLRGTGVSRPGTQRSGPTQLREALGVIRGGALGDNDFVETLNVLVTLLEMPHAEMRGHSAQLARQAVTVARGLGLPPRDLSHIAIASYLHELGKHPSRHCTLANNAQDPEWKNDAKRFCRAPIKLFESIHLPVQVNAILAQLYEAYDGSGTPQGARGDDIAAGARVVAAVDSYLDLTKNPRNAFGRLLPREEALAHLRGQAGVLYDPNVVEILERLHSGEFLKQRVESDGRQVFIAEPEEASRIDLVEELGRRGVVTHSAASVDGVLDAMLRGDSDLLVIGIRFGVPSVTAIVQFLRSRAETSGVPVAVIGEPTEPQGRERLALAGVNAFLPLPLEPGPAATQVEALYQDHVRQGAPGRRVRGSFDEILPATLFQLFGAGRKSGSLTVLRDGSEGVLHFEQGQALFAAFEGKNGQEAVLALAGLTAGDFTYDPNAVLTEVPQVDLPLDRVTSAPPPATPA
jgi:HD-GYP domain-containing protein (c-di-GMP phosphodiesterase class II)/DNA-binding response OmpR family regulator